MPLQASLLEAEWHANLDACAANSSYPGQDEALAGVCKRAGTHTFCQHESQRCQLGPGSGGLTHFSTTRLRKLQGHVSHAMDSGGSLGQAQAALSHNS